MRILESMDLGYLGIGRKRHDPRRVKNLMRYTALSTYTFFFFLPKATEAWIGTIFSTQVTKGECIMTQYICFAVVIVVSLIAILWLSWLLRQTRKKSHISGKLLIDTTGDKDRWTIFFDDDLGDIEKMDRVTLRIEKVE